MANKLKGPSLRNAAIIPCELKAETRQAIVEYAEALKAAAPSVGEHGMTDGQFWNSGLFRGAIERLRGQQVASMAEKREFVRDVLDFLKAGGHVKDWKPSGASDRHDYEVELNGGRLAAIEAKGCLDGNNTNIFERPPHADEFIVWSLCQNLGSNPRHNVWSGIHTRLGVEIIHRRQKVDGVLIWDMVCGTVGRPCPKLGRNLSRATPLGSITVPPPCIYLLPRSIPDPRNNPDPAPWKLEDVGVLEAFYNAFRGDSDDITEVRFQTSMDGADVSRITKLARNGQPVFESGPTAILRANR